MREVIEKPCQVNEREMQLCAKADEMYRFVMRYYDFAMERRDYGTGHEMSMVEVHTLYVLANNPGVTVSEIAARAKRTKSSISQIVKKLEDMGYVYRSLAEDDRRVAYLYPTEMGLELHRAHLQYDFDEVTETIDDLAKYCSRDDIEAFFRVLSVYLKIMDD